MIGLAAIVDDDLLVLRSLELALRTRGVDVVAFQDSSRALDWLQQHHADALITDVVMPGISGSELVRAVREKSPNIPVLFISGKDLISITAALKDETNMTCMRKPIEVRKLIEWVDQVGSMSGSRSQRSHSNHISGGQAC